MNRDKEPLNPAISELLRIAQFQQLHVEALARARGDRFNIFRILGIGHLEVTTHSPVLAELLNPSGTHGLGATFLNLFLRLLKIDPIDTSSAQVKLEYSLGPKTDATGGRVDILISDPAGRRIVIENKIYAGEDETQLRRYKKFAGNNAVIFLTLNGDAPTDSTAQELGNIKCVSYRNDILNWLHACQKEAVGEPRVRETIVQYMHLIKELTHQNMSAQMNEQLTETALESESKCLAFFSICRAERDIRAAILSILQDKIAKIAHHLDLQLEEPIGEMSSTDDGFTFTNHALGAQGIKIAFAFGKSGYRDLYFGFPSPRMELENEAVKVVREFFDQEFGSSNENPYWLAWRYSEIHRNWGDQQFAGIKFGFVAEDLGELIKRMRDVAYRACKLNLGANPT